MLFLKIKILAKVTPTDYNERLDELSKMKKHYRKRKTSSDNKMNYTPLLKFQIKSTQCSLNAQLPGKQTEELARDKSKAMPGKLRELSIKLKLSPFYKTIHDICMIWKMLHSQSKHDDYRIVWAIDKAQSSKFQTPGQKASTEQQHRPPQGTKMIANVSNTFWIQLNLYFSKYCASDAFAQLLINIRLCNCVICASALYF